MKKTIYSILLLLFIFTAKAAKVDTLQVFSASMQKNIKTCVVVPDNYKKSKKAFPVVYLLHGYSGNYRSWAKDFKELGKQVDQYGFIVVGVDGNYSSWYFDSPNRSDFQI
ncbi:alpha/beta hydrolase-fold protein [Flavobacterium luteolum]|uniref:alpha/beta hydrolase-fold protein n=1 Tax=Flavobacterium luteolum TaxID=3003259 RepID=UPI00248D6CA3|nr:alpha/beta hydrolase-fold protein [Flavobacterium luteolum]